MYLKISPSPKLLRWLRETNVGEKEGLNIRTNTSDKFLKFQFIPIQMSAGNGRSWGRPKEELQAVVDGYQLNEHLGISKMQHSRSCPSCHRKILLLLEGKTPIRQIASKAKTDHRELVIEIKEKETSQTFAEV